MLVLSRKPEERILIGDDIVVTFLGMRGGAAKLGVEAPPHIPIIRGDAKRKTPRFSDTYCSQCGRSTGPGDHGYSHCEHHRK